MKFFAAGLTFVNVATMAGLILGIVGAGSMKVCRARAVSRIVAAILPGWEPQTLPVRKKVVFSARAAAAEIEARTAPDETANRNRSRHRRRGRGVAFLGLGGRNCLYDVRGALVLLASLGGRQPLQDPVAQQSRRSLAAHYLYQVLREWRPALARQSDPPLQQPALSRRGRSLQFASPSPTHRSDSRARLDGAARLGRDLLWVLSLGRSVWGGGFLFNGGLAGVRILQPLSLRRLSGGQDCVEKHSADDVRDPAWLALRDSRPACSCCCTGGENIIRGDGDEPVGAGRGLVPWWVEWSIYATMPLFPCAHFSRPLGRARLLAAHRHLGDAKQIALLLAAAFVPATGSSG